MVSLAICIATYKRPAGLERLLLSLARLEGAGREFDRLWLVVVDNDPAGSARELIERMRPELPWKVVDGLEPRQGIPHVRNRTVALALERGVDFLAFIDDDEVASPQWLVRLLRMQRETGAVAVGGPVKPLFEVPLPAWKDCLLGDRGSLHFRDRQETGVCNMGNALISAAAIRRIEGPFDPRLSDTGGEDTLLSLELCRKGGRIFWAREAWVYEHVPANRISLWFHLKRYYRFGNCVVLSERIAYGNNRKMMLTRLVKGLLRAAAGLVLLPGALVLGRCWLFLQLRGIARGLGMLGALAGLLHREYVRAPEDASTPADRGGRRAAEV